MLYSKLTRWARKRKPADPSLPPGLRVYAIGDIHGRLDLFDALLTRIDSDDAARGGKAETWLILVGDLIDRGPESAGVVQRALELRQSGRNVRFLLGNHEEVLLRAVRGDEKAMRFLIRIGGRATVRSYGVTDEEYQDLHYDELTALFGKRVPAEHVEFLESFENMIELGDYVFVHAGIRPGVEMEAQKFSDLRWIRDDFLNHEGDHGRVIVHGHSISEDIEHRHNRIGIDTGAFASGRLSAVALENDAVWFLSTEAADATPPV